MEIDKETSTPENVRKSGKIEKMEEKLKTICEIINQLADKKRHKEEEKSKEWKKKVKAKDRREKEKREEEEKRDEISERWEMMKLVTNYIENNQEEWEKDKSIREKEIEKEIEDWKKLKRLEKIKHLQKVWERKKEMEINAEKEKKKLFETKIITENEAKFATTTLENDEISGDRWGKGVPKREGWLCPHLLSPHPQ